MKRFLNYFSATLLGLSILCLGAPALADSGTQSDAQAMVKKGSAFLKANGKDTFLAEASNPKGQFVNNDIYLSVYDAAGVVLAHGTNAKLIGKDVSELKDPDGKYFIKDILAKAKSSGSGWVDYKWPNPVTKAIQAKSVYVEMADGIVIASGYYKK